MTTLTILCILSAISGASFLIGFLQDQSAAEDQDAADTFRRIVHRNGVTEVSPWSAAHAPINAPGLVLVQPHTQRPPMPPPPVQPARPTGPSVAKPDDSPLLVASELPKLPIELADEPTESEAEIIVAWWEDGFSMTKTIKSVWGISSGGGKRYATARARYKHYLSQVSAS
ncbi:MAG: hypothetical protein AAFN38_21760 [Cyanobacteria bacterium J06560_5]